MRKKQSEKYLHFLKKVILFRDIPEEYIESLLESVQLKSYSSGETIIQEGAKGHSVFFLFRGKVAITKRMSLFDEFRVTSQVDKALIKMKDSDYAFFGEMSLCGHSEVRSATVTAEMDCILGEISADSIHEMVENHSDFGKNFYRNLSEVLSDRLRKANRDILKLTTALTLALE